MKPLYFLNRGGDAYYRIQGCIASRYYPAGTAGLLAGVWLDSSFKPADILKDSRNFVAVPYEDVILEMI
jgi:hypothetical protein